VTLRPLASATASRFDRITLVRPIPCVRPDPELTVRECCDPRKFTIPITFYLTMVRYVTCRVDLEIGAPDENTRPRGVEPQRWAELARENWFPEPGRRAGWRQFVAGDRPVLELHRGQAGGRSSRMATSPSELCLNVSVCPTVRSRWLFSTVFPCAVGPLARTGPALPGRRPADGAGTFLPPLGTASALGGKTGSAPGPVIADHSHARRDTCLPVMVLIRARAPIVVRIPMTACGKSRSFPGGAVSHRKIKFFVRFV